MPTTPPDVTSVTLYDATGTGDGIIGKIVSYTVAPFSYAIESDGPRRQVTYQVPSSRGPDFIDRLLGLSNYVTGSVNFPKPHAYPGNVNLHALTARLTSLLGYAKPSPQLQESTDFAHITCDYGVVPWSPLGDDFQTFFDGNLVPWSFVDVDMGFEEHRADSVILDNGQPSKSAKAILPVITYTFRRTMIANPAGFDDALVGLVGRTNSLTFMRKPAGTVRFDSFGMHEEERDPSGQRVFTFTMMMKYRTVSWNKFLTPGTFTGWRYPDDLSDYPYVSVDFTPLYTFGVS